MARYTAIPLILAASVAGADCLGTAHLGRTEYQVEIVATPASRAQGLMGREMLADDAGMLFLFSNEAPRAFWMKDTPLPLDIAFYNNQGQLVALHQGRPFDETPLPSPVSAAVLEVNVGHIAQTGLLDYTLNNVDACPPLAKNHPLRKGN